MNLKIVGAWLIGWGVMSLMFSFIGLHLGILWFMEEFGPVVGYLLKGGLIVLGVVVWRRDRLSASEDDDGEEKRSLVPLVVCGVLVVGITAYIIGMILKEKHLEQQLARLPAPAQWAAKPAEEWPPLVLLQQADFKTRSRVSGGCACLVRLPDGQVAALTARHLLGNDRDLASGMVFDRYGIDSTRLAGLNSEIVSWKLFLPAAQDQAVTVAGLMGDAADFENCDQVLLRLTLAPVSGKVKYPVRPLGLRLQPPHPGEALSLVRYSVDDDGVLLQEVCPAHRTSSLLFMCELDEPADLRGCSGAPVVDKNGLLVGIATAGLVGSDRGSGQFRNFMARPVTELLPVLKSTVKLPAKPGAMQLEELLPDQPAPGKKPGVPSKKPWKPPGGSTFAWN
jgi:hypothetical protein